jgi:hypothetical protein
MYISILVGILLNRLCATLRNNRGSKGRQKIPIHIVCQVPCRYTSKEMTGTRNRLRIILAANQMIEAVYKLRKLLTGPISMILFGISSLPDIGS